MNFQTVIPDLKPQNANETGQCSFTAVTPSSKDNR